MKPGSEAADRFQQRTEKGDEAQRGVRLAEIALPTPWRTDHLDVHGAGSSRRLDAIFVANSGADAQPFDWGIDQTEFQIAARTQAFQGRIGDPNDPAACGPTVHVGASAGLMRLPIRSGPYTAFRVHAYGSAISDIPYSSELTLDMDIEAYSGIRVELFRGVVREALRTW